MVSAQYLGKKKSENACRAAGQLLVTTTCLSLVFAFAALIGNRHLLSLIFGSVEEAVMNNAMIYFFLCALSYPFLAVYNSCAALFRAMGNSKISMFASLIMNGINVIGNTICIFGLRMGVEGVGIPTLLARAFAALLMLYLIQNPNNVVRVRNLKELRFDPRMVKNILAIGVPNGLESAMFHFGKIALQSLVSSLGTAAIASYAVACNLVTLQYLPGNALGMGLITIVGQCVGAGKLDEAKKYTKGLLRINYGILIVICTAMAIGRTALVGIYQLSPEAAAISAGMLLFHSCIMIVWPMGFCLPSALRAGSDAKFTMLVSIVSMWVFRIGFSYIFIRGLKTGVMGVWYAMSIDWLARAIIYTWRFHGFEHRRLSKI